MSASYRIFLLSPANAKGPRGAMLLNPEARFDLAVRLRTEGASLAEAFSFISGLYFRGKVAYAQAFSAPPPDIPAAFVITPGLGLIPFETQITVEHLRYTARVPIDLDNPEYRIPLERDSRTLDEIAGPACEFVLLGSVATLKYLQPLVSIFRDRLLYPAEFAGRGDMSRGGLMLRSARAGTPLTYIPLGTATRHGPRPPKLPKLRRS